MTNQTKAVFLMGLNLLIWSINPSIFKILSTILAPEQTIALGMGIAALCSFFSILWRREFKQLIALPGKKTGIALTQGVILFLYYQCYFTAYIYLSPQLVMPVSVTWCLMMAVLAVFFLGQTMCRAELFWIAFAYAGVLVSVLGAENLGPVDPRGFVCAAACSILYAAYWIMNTKSGIPQNQSFLICFTVSSLLAVAVLFFRGAPVSLSPEAFAGCVYIGLLELTVPYILMGWAFRIADSVSRLATMQLSLPFLSLIWIHALLHESIVWTTPVALAMILTGVVMQKRAAARHSIIS